MDSIAVDYMTVGIANPVYWANWFPGEGQELPAARAARLLPKASFLTLPQKLVFGHDPFKSAGMSESIEERHHWLSATSFAKHSESLLAGVGFEPQAAKLLTYYRMCLLTWSAGAIREEWAGMSEDLCAGQYQLTIDSVPLDDHAFRTAMESWPMLVLVIMSGYADAGYAFTAPMVAYCQRAWRMTPWPRFLEEHHLSWEYLTQYFARSFSPRGLYMALSHRILLGDFYYASVYDVVTYSITDKCAMAMVSPWGPMGAAAWWKMVTATICSHISTRRATLKTHIARFPTGAFPAVISSWVKADIHPMYDLFRMIVPVLMETMRPLYVPSATSDLYLDLSGNADRIMRHASSFSEQMIASGFGQDMLERSRPDFELMASLSEQGITKRLGFDSATDEYVPLTELTTPIESVKAWQFPTVRKATFQDYKVILTAGYEALGVTAPLQITGPSPIPMVEIVDEPPMDNLEAALMEARRKMGMDRNFYSDEAFKKYMLGSQSDINRWMQPTLKAAKVRFDEVYRSAT